MFRPLGRPAAWLVLAAAVLGGSPAQAERAPSAAEKAPLAAPEKTPSERGAVAAPRSLTGPEILHLAKTLAGEGRPADAEKLYQALLHSGHPEEFRLEAAFQLGLLLIARGEFRQAALYFNAILNRRPEAARARLELAVAYFLNRDYEDATLNFELLKGAQLPPEVLAKVDAFLDAIRRQKNWRVDFFMIPVADSNLNQASGEREECLETVFGRLCRPLEEKTGGRGLSIAASADYFHRLGQDWGIKGGLDVSILEYQGRAYDDYSLGLSLGPRRLWNSGEASLAPYWRGRWLAGKPYSREYGLRLEGSRVFGRLIVDAGADYGRTRYADSGLDALLRGPQWGLRGQARYILNDRTFVQAGLDFRREEARDEAWANEARRYALGAYRALPYGLALFTEASLTSVAYQGSQWFVSRDGRIEETERRDSLLGFSAALSSNLWEKYNLFPSLQYAHTERRSNIWSREYERDRLNLLFRFRY